MSNLLIAVAAALGVAGLVSVFVFALLALIRLVERKRHPRIDEYQIWDDVPPVHMTGNYRTGVEVRYPEPADQVADDDKRIPPLPKGWPGLCERGTV